MEETPQTHHLPPLAVSISLFFNPNNKHTQPQETTTPPRYPQNGQRGWQGAARPGRWGIGAGGRGKGEKVVRCRVCASHSSRRWAGARLAPQPTATSQGRWRAQSGQDGALREGAGTEFKTMVHVMQYPRWAPRGGEGGHHTHLPWARGGMAPTLGEEVGQLQLQRLGGWGCQAGSWHRRVPSGRARQRPFHPARP